MRLRKLGVCQQLYKHIYADKMFSDAEVKPNIIFSFEPSGLFIHL